jgi:hypothetical protein
MRNISKFAEPFSARWYAPALSLACLAAIALSFPVHAQERRDRIISCASVDGQRTSCDTDLNNSEVRVTKQLSEVRCIEGYTWGRDEHGIWTDRGCRAEFVVTPLARPHFERRTTIEPGTVLIVRTDETIRSDRADGRVFTGSVKDDVLGSDGRLAIPAGSSIELMVRVAQDKDLILDLDSVVVEGQRYALDASSRRVGAEASKEGVGANERTGKYVGGGAALGAIIGAIAGGGSGAAIGAGAGAVGGAIGQTVTRGREVRIPAESLLTFRIERPLTMGVVDNGTLNGGYHYHPEEEGK